MIRTDLVPVAAARFKALSDPGRLTLLALLFQEGEQSVSDLVGASGRAQPTVSQQLAHLSRARLIGARREGNRVYYRIVDPYVKQICDAVCRGWSDARRSRGSRG